MLVRRYFAAGDMIVRIGPYSGKVNRLRYSCSRGVSDDGAPLCLSLSGAFLERFVVAPMLHVRQPAS
jgi:hypothetical protein